MLLACFYFFTKMRLDVLIKGVLIKKSVYSNSAADRAWAFLFVTTLQPILTNLAVTCLDH